MNTLEEAGEMRAGSQSMADRVISVHLTGDLYWPAVMTVLCLGVVLVESALAVFLLATR